MISDDYSVDYDVKDPWYLCIEYTETTRCTREPDEDDSWDRGNYKITIEFRRVFKTQDQKKAFALPQWSRVTHLDLGELDEVFLTLVTYYDGDTFGSTSGYVSIAGVSASREEAEEIEKSIRDCTYREKYDGFCSWNRYFAGVEDISVESFELQEVK